MARDYGYVRSLEELQSLADTLLKDGGRVGFDVETGYSGKPADKRSLDVFHPDQFVVGFSITNDPSWARYVPLRHDNCPDNLNPIQAWEIIRPVLEQLEVVAHHKKFEDKNLRLLKQKGDALAPIITKPGQDTMIDAYVLSEWKGVQHGDGINAATGLKQLVLAVLNHRMTEFAELFEEEITQVAKKRLRFNVLPLSQKVVEYACEDAALCLELFYTIHDRASSLKHGLEWVPEGFIRKIETSITEILTDMEMRGVAVDWAAMETSYTHFEPFAEEVLKSVKRGLGAMAGEDMTDLNVRSTKQMQTLLFEKIGLTTSVLTAKGKPSVGEQALEGLSREHPTLKKFLEYKQVMNLGERHRKWLNTYRDYPDGRVHAEYAQNMVASGRFSAADPSIQQLPKKWFWDNRIEGVDTGEVAEWSGNFRDFIVAPEGYTLLTFDYSQVELRVLAGVSQEKYLLEAFANGDDVHTLTAAMMLGKDPADIDPDTERPFGKTFNFALLYQMGLKSMAERLAVSMDRAKELYENYFNQFTSVRTWMEDTVLDGIKTRCAFTPFGRKARVWELDDHRRGVAKKGERLLINLPIQGGAADYMKIGMVRAANALKERGWWGDQVMIIMNQHDSLTFEVRNDMDMNEVRAVIQEAVVFPIPDFPDIVADWELGRSWGSSQKWHLSVDAVQAPDGTWSVPTEEETVPEVEEEEAYAEVIPLRQESKVETDWCLEFETMPNKSTLEDIVAVIKNFPGRSSLSLRTPHGMVTTLITFGMTKDLAAQVHWIHPGSHFIPDEVDIDVESFAQELALESI